METREEVIRFCKTFKDVYEDYPFHDRNMAVIRHSDNKKVFAWIFNREGRTWINVKCDPVVRDLLRSAYDAVVPAYHLNKEHWSSIILDGTIPEEEVVKMLQESYDLTKPKIRRRKE